MSCILHYVLPLSSPSLSAGLLSSTFMVLLYALRDQLARAVFSIIIDREPVPQRPNPHVHGGSYRAHFTNSTNNAFTSDRQPRPHCTFRTCIEWDGMPAGRVYGEPSSRPTELSDW